MKLKSLICGLVSVGIIGTSTATDLTMINNASNSITNNNLNEILNGMPLSVQTQRLYALTAGKPVLIAQRFPDTATTTITLVRSVKDFKSGNVQMVAELIAPVEERDAWSNSPRSVSIYGTTSSPANPFSQFVVAGAPQGDLNYNNWYRADMNSLPAIMSVLASKYGAVKTSIIDIQNDTLLRTWTEKKKKGLQKQPKGQNYTWLKPHIYVGDYQENSGSRGSNTAYTIAGCSGKCTVVSNLKFIDITDSENGTRFEYFTTSGAHDMGKAGWNSLISVAIGAALAYFTLGAGAALWSAASAAGSILASGESLTNSYVSTDKLLTIGVMSTIPGAPGTTIYSALATTMSTAELYVKDSGKVFGAEGYDSSSIYASMSGTTASNGSSASSSLITASSIIEAQANISTDSVRNKLNSDANAKQQMLAAYQTMQDEIGKSATSGISGPVDKRYFNDNFNPNNKIVSAYFSNPLYQKNGTNVTTVSPSAQINAQFNKYGDIQSQQTVNDIKLLNNMASKGTTIQKIGGISTLSSYKKESVQTSCKLNSDSPC